MIVNYEMEEGETAIDIADMLLEQLILESVEALNKTERSRSHSYK